MFGLCGLKADMIGSWDGGDQGDQGDFGYSSLPSGYTSFRAELVILEQGGTNTTTNGITTVHLKDFRVDTDDILGLINEEFGTSFSVTNGDKLVISNAWNGTFSVLSKTNSVLLANASSGTGSYRLSFYVTNSVYAEKMTTNCETKYSVGEGNFVYQSGNGLDSFHLQGLTTVNDSYFHTNSAESFQLSGGVGTLSFSDTNEPDPGSGIIDGSISGSGRNNAPAP